MDNYYLDKINSFLHPILPFTRELKTVTFRPEQLLSPCRFDVIIKYLYLKYINLGVNVDWAKEIYVDQISAFSNGKFYEGDFKGKDSIGKYLDAFFVIANSIRQHGFNEKESLLPLSSEKVIIDGAHRLAACLYYKRDVSCLLFEAKSPNYNFRYFKNRGMKSESLDLAALEYTKLNVNTYILTVFPIAAKKVDDINSIIERYGKIYYQKDIYFNSAGALNFVRQLYYGELWAGDFKKGFPGERQKVEQCFRENIPLKAYFLETDSLDKVKVCKKEIRSLFDYGNNSAHATDGRDETIRIAEQLLNNNSIHFLNNSNYVYSNKLENMLLTYKKWMNENSYDKDSFCLDSGAVLNIYGIRDTRDLDFLYFGNENLKNTPEHIDNHQSELIYYERSPEEIIFNPANYFYYNGLKFASLNVVMKMKLKRNEVKDKRDVILIKRILSNSFSIYQALLSARYKTLQELRYFPDRIKYLVLKISPSGMLPYLKAVYRIPGKIKAISYSLYECLGPYERTRIYKGFNLAYTRGYSLVSRIIGNGIYEPKLSQEIVKELRKTKSGYFLDVGANIGLVSLNVLSELPNMKIFCIEPGPEQAGQLRRTININNLTGQMQLFQCALGDNEGESQFAVHSSLNTSGDGFFDSKLAVKCSFITVPVNTLDNWWRSAGSCLIKVVKIDTEGAELWILRGGERFIRQCRPTILLEIDRRYIKPYPYHERDLLKYLEMMQYGLKTLDETRVTSNNFDYCLGETNSYVATPNEHDAG